MPRVCSKPRELGLQGWLEREERRTHRVRFIFSRFSSLLGPLLSIDPQSCWTARNMALCIIVQPRVQPLVAARARSGIYKRRRVGAWPHDAGPAPRGRLLGGCGWARGRVCSGPAAAAGPAEGSGSQGAADVCGPGLGRIGAECGGRPGRCEADRDLWL